MDTIHIELTSDEVEYLLRILEGSRRRAEEKAATSEFQRFHTVQAEGIGRLKDKIADQFQEAKRKIR